MDFRIFLLAGFLLATFMQAPAPLASQEGTFAFQVRGGSSIPVLGFRSKDEGWEGKTGPGASFSMGFTIPLLTPLGGYLGFSQHRFGCDGNVCPDGRDWVSTGFDVALRVVMGGRRFRSWLQAGLHTHRVEGRVRLDGGVRSLVSQGGGGYEAGGGILVRIGDRMSLAPGLRYGDGNVPFSGRSSLRPRYVVLDLGLIVGF
jgi:hypothetical protein